MTKFLAMRHALLALALTNAVACVQQTNSHIKSYDDDENPVRIPDAVDANEINQIIPQPQNSIPGGAVQIGDLKIEAPGGWSLHQQASANGVIFAGFTNGSGYVRFYYKKGVQNLDIRQIFPGASRTAGSGFESAGKLNWEQMQGGSGQARISAFKTSLNGSTYYGFARGDSAAQYAVSFLGLVQPQTGNGA